MHNHNPEDMVHFAVVVDEEVVSYMGFLKENEMNIAIYRSNPVFIEINHDQRPPLGYKWDGKMFTSPEAE